MSSVERRTFGFTPSEGCGRGDRLGLMGLRGDRPCREVTLGPLPARRIENWRSLGFAPQARRGFEAPDPEPDLRQSRRGGSRAAPHHPGPRDGSRHRVPVHSRRVDAGRQRAPQPGDVRDDVDGAAGRAAHGRHVRQEHDRQGRVPTHRRARAALRQHAERLWSSPDQDEATGTSTTGSSEAAMLAGMSLKWRWRDRRRAAGKPTDRPNMVMGANVQVCWEKFCRYWDVEARLVPMEGDTYHLTAAQAVEHCDENTIAVVSVLGSTFDGSYEPVADICAALDKLRADTGLDVPVHVDGASGGFLAPFIDPDLVGDFRLPRVQSINSSGHKYGLVYPGVGWVVWRDPDALPDDLVFKVNYLGGDMPTFALNFSRPGNQVAAQYYNFLRLGFDGYRRVQQECRDVATYGAAAIAELGPFELITDGSELPVFAFKVRDEVDNFSAFDVSGGMRERGWQVPAYSFPENREDLVALRVVVRNGYSRDIADMFLDDLKRLLVRLEKQPSPTHDESYAGFAH